jgi:hypothetical protein
VIKVLLDRYDGRDADKQDLRLLLHARAKCFRNYEDRVQALLEDIEQWAPHLSQRARLELAKEISERPLTWKADTLARALRVDKATRDRLKLKSIGAVDFLKRDRAAARREENRRRAERNRRARGALAREEYVRIRQEKSVRRLLADQGVPASTHYYKLKLK